MSVKGVMSVRGFVHEVLCYEGVMSVRGLCL